MDRVTFLDRLRSRLAGPAHPNPAHPLIPVSGVPQVLASVEAFLADVAAAVGATTVAVSKDPEVRDAALERPVVPPAQADLGIVGAAWGIAATGTVVFDASRAGGRSVSLVPPAIAVLLREENVVADAGAFFRAMGAWFAAGPPSQLVLCTGPSKSGDIELELTTGVHGPGRVCIGLLGDAS